MEGNCFLQRKLARREGFLQRKRARKEGEEEEEEKSKLTIAIQRSEKSLDSLPHEIVHDMLLKGLPVKSLLQFKDVCKSWRGLISDPQFVKSHFDLSTKNWDNVTYCHLSRFRDCRRPPSVSLSYINREASEVKTVKRDVPFTYPFQWDPHSNPDVFFEVLGYCNGLVLIGYSHLTLLWNPSTGECIKHVTRYGGLLHKTSASYISGLAYDSSVDEYKAVVLLKTNSIEVGYRYFKEGVSHMFVCSTSGTENGYWKKVDVNVHEFPYRLIFNSSHLGITVNGAPHWAVKSSEPNLLSLFDTIIYFDMVEEKFKKLSTPPLPRSSNQSLNNIVVLGGCMCAILSFHDVDFDVWAMKEYGVKESWTKLFVIRMSSEPWSLTPLGFTKDGDEVVLLINQNKLVHLVAYNLRTKEEKLVVSTKIKSGAVYVESLVSPKCSCEKMRVQTY